MESFGKVLGLNLLKQLLTHFKNEEGIEKSSCDLKILEQFFIDNLNGKNYLSGHDDPMYIDIFVITMVDFLFLMEGSVMDEGW